MRCNTTPYDPCPLGVINSKCIVYTGTNLTNINVSTNDRLDTILININNSLNNLSFTLYTEDTNTIDLSGSGTLQHPLYGDVIISDFPNNATQALISGIWSPNVIQHGVVYGGIVTWLQDYDYHVSPAQYYINGILYNSPAADFTLNPPDGTFNRIDTFIVDTTSAALVLEGTPSSNPAQAGVDTSTQLELSLALVEVGTTEPTIATECIYKNNNEGPTWTNSSSNTTRLNPDSTTTPCNGTKSIEASGLLTGDNILFTRNANFTPGTSHSLVTFYLKSKGFSGNNNNFRIQWEFSGTPVGTAVTVRNGQFGFDGLDVSSCQVVSIPFSFFGITSVSIVNSVRITGSVALAGGIGFFIDDLCLQGQPLPDAPSSPDEKVKVSLNDTTPGYLNGKLVAGTGITFTENNNGLNETLTITAAVANTFDNGLTTTGTNIQFGGTLLHTTQLDTDTFKLNMIGSNATELLSVINSGSGNGGYFKGNLSTGTGVVGEGLFGGVFTGSFGVQGITFTNGGLGGAFNGTFTTTGTMADIVSITRQSTGTAVSGIGAAINFQLQDAGGGVGSIGHIGYTLSDPTAGAVDSAFQLYTTNNSSAFRRLSVASTGQLTLDAYNSGIATFTGTPTFNLSVDSSGNVIQTSLSAGAQGLQDVITQDPILTAANTIDAQSFTQTWDFNGVSENDPAFVITRVNVPDYSQSGASATALYVSNTATSIGPNDNVTGINSVAQDLGGNAVVTAISGAASGGLLNIGVHGATTDGFALYGSASAAGIGLVAQSDGGLPAQLIYTSATSNSVINMLFLERRASVSNATAGVGNSIDFVIPTDTGAGIGQATSQLIFQLTDANSATATSQFEIWLNNTGSAAAKKFQIAGSGAMTLGPAYQGLGAGYLAVSNTGLVTWSAATGSMTNPMTTTGDIIYSSDGSGTPARRGIGTAGQVLTVSGGLPTWVTPGVGGSVTSVAQSFTGGLISVSGSPITTSGTLALTVAGTSGGIPYFSSTSTWASSALLAANAIMIGGGTGTAPSTTTTGTGILTALGINTGSAGSVVLFNGALGTPSSGTATNLTGLPLTTGVTGTLPATNGGTGTATVTAGDLLYGSGSNVWSKLPIGTNGQVLTLTGGLPAWVTVSGTGTVTSVNASGGSTGLTFSGGPITSSGTLTLAGTLAAVNGGTGQTSYVIGDILQASSTTALSKLAAVATGNVLISGGVGTVSSWGKVGLTTHVSGRLPFANIVQVNALSVMGNPTAVTADLTNMGSPAANSIMRANTGNTTIGFGTINLAAAGAVGTSILLPVNGGTGQSSYTNGQLLIGNTTGNTLTKATITQGQGMQIVNGAGSITIASSFNPARQTLTDATTITWNIDNGESAVVTLGNIGRTLSITNPVAGRVYLIEIIQDGSGNRTITTWPTGTTWVGGAPTLSTTAGAVDMVSFYRTATGYRALFNGPFA